MFNEASSDGWNRVTAGLDIKVQHGVPVRIANTSRKGLDSAVTYSTYSVTSKNLELTGITVSMHDWVNISANEQVADIYLRQIIHNCELTNKHIT